MNDVLVESDIISIHLPLNDETEDMINADVLSKLKPSAVIVNTARGGIVVEEDLANFLRIYDDSFAGTNSSFLLSSILFCQISPSCSRVI